MYDNTAGIGPEHRGPICTDELRPICVSTVDDVSRNFAALIWVMQMLGCQQRCRQTPTTINRWLLRAWMSLYSLLAYWSLWAGDDGGWRWWRWDDWGWRGGSWQLIDKWISICSSVWLHDYGGSQISVDMSSWGYHDGFLIFHLTIFPRSAWTMDEDQRYDRWRRWRRRRSTASSYMDRIRNTSTICRRLMTSDDLERWNERRHWIIDILM